MSALACANCGATDVRLDLDIKSTPPEHVCRKCMKMSRCTSCKKRRRALVAQQGGGATCIGGCVKRRKPKAPTYFKITSDGAREPGDGIEHRPRCALHNKYGGRCALIVGHDGEHAALGVPGTACVGDHVLVLTEDAS